MKIIRYYMNTRICRSIIQLLLNSALRMQLRTADRLIYVVIRRDPDVSETEALWYHMTSRERTFTSRDNGKGRAVAVAFAAFVANKRVREKMRNVSGWVKRHGWVQVRVFPQEERSGEFPAKEWANVSVCVLIDDVPAKLQRLIEGTSAHWNIMCVLCPYSLKLYPNWRPEL